MSLYVFMFLLDEQKLRAFLGVGTSTLYYWNIRFVFAFKAALLDRIHRIEWNSSVLACGGGFFCFESIAVFRWVSGSLESFCIHYVSNKAVGLARRVLASPAANIILRIYVLLR